MTRLLACLLIASCGGNARPPAPQNPAVAAVEQPEKPAPAAAVQTSAQLGVGTDLAEQCKVRITSRDQTPKFDYDGFQLLPDDRAVLEQIAQCLSTGPLRGRKVDLVGRADPRGTEEYNLGLGMRRAGTVADFLKRLGVAPDQLGMSTRGALDAGGVDETSWRGDRRVDLQLRPI
jgi:peptidoglycan-associated lipoprotein